MNNKLLGPQKGTKMLLYYSLVVLVFVFLSASYLFLTGAAEVLSEGPAVGGLWGLYSIWKILRNVGLIFAIVLIVYGILHGVSLSLGVKHIVSFSLKVSLITVFLSIFTFPLGMATSSLIFSTIAAVNVSDSSPGTKGMLMFFLLVAYGLIFVVLPLLVIFLVKYVQNRGNEDKAQRYKDRLIITFIVGLFILFIILLIPVVFNVIGYYFPLFR